MNEQEFKQIFLKQKVDIPDENFSERIAKHLPERKSMLPHLLMAIFTIVGLALMIAIQGITPIIEQFNRLIASVCHLQMPTSTSIIAYVGALTITGFIGYSVAHADVG